MRLILAISLICSGTAFAGQIKDYLYFCENPSESASATHTVELIRSRMVYDHEWDMSGSCADQFKKIKTVSSIWINGFNDLVDVRPFANLPLLKNLAFPRNRVQDISPLITSPNLEVLTFWGNEISDISSLASFKHLRSVSLDENKIIDPSPLGEIPTLIEVGLSQNKIQTAEFIKNLPDLVYLGLSQTEIKTLPDLSVLKNLQVINLSFNRLSEVPGLGKLTSLRELDISSNSKINSIESLRDLHGLRHFYGFACSFSTIPELPSFLDNSSSWGFDLNLAENKISDLSALRNLNYSIYNLILKQNKINDLSVFSTTKGMTSMDISSNQVEDLSPLTNIIVHELIAAHNFIKSLENFEPKYLSSLDLSDNQISAISPLASSLPNMFNFRIGRNPIKDIEKINLLNPNNLPMLDISGLGLTDLGFINKRLLGLVKGIDVSNNNLTDVSTLLESTIADYISIGCNPNLPQNQIDALVKRHNFAGRQVVSMICH